MRIPSGAAARRGHGVLFAVLVLCCSPGGASAETRPEAPGSRLERVRDFSDKWLINGGNLGQAAGAVAGQFAIRRFLPGPLGLVLGSWVGSHIGQIVGELLDNKVHRSYNYVAFNRPALGEAGSVVLQGAGKYEQAFYQIDRFALNGGSLAILGTHFALNAAAGWLPGARWLASPLVLFLADYVAGNIGDNIDGTRDLSRHGRRIDESRAANHREAPADPAAPSPPGAGSTAEVRAAYTSLMTALGNGDSAAITRAYEHYQILLGQAP